MNLLCVDIGNSNVHFGIVRDRKVQAHATLATPLIDHPIEGLGPWIERLGPELIPIEGVAFASVVPPAGGLLERLLEDALPGTPIFPLTWDRELGVGIAYPNPPEIGQDRLANAVAAKACHRLPAIVIDAGTAVTFDIVTRAGGYEGGIIAPGFEIMRRYLHEQTALLPLLDDSFEAAGTIGRSTEEAMRIGCVIGFGGMIEALLKAVLSELARRGEPEPTLIATGGSADLLRKSLKIPIENAPDLTLIGLAVAYELNRTP